MITQPDSSGGLGSFRSDLLGTLTGGLKLIAAGELGRRYGFSFGADGQVAVNTDGTIRSASEPASDVKFGDQLAAAFSNPLVVAVVAAVGIGVFIAIVRR